MDWLDYALRAYPYLCGAVASVVTFVFLRLVRSKPVRAGTSVVGAVGFCLLAAFKVMHMWPPTLIQSEILVGTILTCLLLGWMLSRWDSITFDPATREFSIEQPVLRSALTALFAGVYVALAPQFSGTLGDGAAFAAACAWMAGGAFAQWRGLVRADEA